MEYEGRYGRPLEVRQGCQRGYEKLVAAEKQKILDGKWDVFTGPIKGQDGKVVVPQGKKLSDGEMLSMNWFVEGVEGTIPK